MMMPHDSSQTPPGRLDEATIDAMRAALQQYLADDARTEPLGAQLARMAAEAREREMLPEQLLVVLKDIWSALPEVRSMADAGEQVRLLQRVVTMCIRAYYSA